MDIAKTMMQLTTRLVMAKIQCLHSFFTIHCVILLLISSYLGQDPKQSVYYLCHISVNRFNVVNKPRLRADSTYLTDTFLMSYEQHKAEAEVMWLVARLRSRSGILLASNFSSTHLLVFSQSTALRFP
jgi:hypothetical protein